MTKIILCFAFLSGFCSYILAQNRSLPKVEVILRGYVKDSYDSSLVMNALLNLVTDSGLVFQQKTDSSGFYQFRFNKKKYRHVELTIQTGQYTKSKTVSLGFFKSIDTVRLSFGKLSGNLISQNDFYLDRVVFGVEPPSPKILFKKDQVTFDTATYGTYYYLEDSLYAYPFYNLTAMKDILSENPSITIELSGHCSIDEVLPDQLSLLRAERVKSELIKRGIDELRIIAKGYSNHKLLIKPDVVKKAKNSKGERDFKCEKPPLCI